MQRHYDNIAEIERDGFKVIVDKTWEDLHPSDCFDDNITDIEKLCDNIDSGHYDWFMLRVRVFAEDLELGSHFLGGCLYEDANDVMKDGTAEDCISEAVKEAKSRLTDLAKQFTLMAIKHS